MKTHLKNRFIFCGLYSMVGRFAVKIELNRVLPILLMI